MSDFSVVTDAGIEFDAVEADFLLPYFGNWTSYVMFDSADKSPSGACTVTCLGRSWRGYIYSSRSNVTDGRHYCMIVGGAGGLSAEAKAISFNYQLSVRSVLSTILPVGQETISPDSSSTVLDTIVDTWHASKGTVESQLSVLVDLIGGVWRVQPDGGIYVGTDSFPEAKSIEYVVQKEIPTAAMATMYLTEMAFLPGMAFPETEDYPNMSLRRIGAARYSVGSKFAQVSLWFLDENVYTDPAHQAIYSFIQETQRGVDYYRTYSCRVVEVRGDGTVDIEPYEDIIPPMTSVRLRTSCGFHYTPEVNENGMVCFEDGNPKKAVYVSTQMGTGTKSIARQDDEVDVGSLKFTAVANGVIQGTYTDGFGAPVPFVLGTSIPLKGKIKTGHPRIKTTGET